MHHFLFVILTRTETTDCKDVYEPVVQRFAMTAVAASSKAHRSQLVKAGKQLVQRHDQLLGRALRCQAGEALNVRKQYAAGEMMGMWGGKQRGEAEQTEGKKGEKKETQNAINQHGVEAAWSSGSLLLFNYHVSKRKRGRHLFGSGSHHSGQCRSPPPALPSENTPPPLDPSVCMPFIANF